jgi:hypothetical protein
MTAPLDSCRYHHSSSARRFSSWKRLAREQNHFVKQTNFGAWILIGVAVIGTYRSDLRGLRV